MIVRESPNKKAKTNQTAWPPKSPFEALLSSPSGRRKYEERRRTATSPSPSPSKRRPVSRHTPEDDEEEEDEETLQLKLQALEAKIKLKKLQQRRKAAEGAETESNASSSRPPTATSMRRADLPPPPADVQVPHSPVRRRQAPDEPKSPARVLLGIDKGWRAQDVSLKRPAAGVRGTSSRSDSARSETPKIKSFSERMAESRTKENEKEKKETKAEERRSHGFGLRAIEGLQTPSRSSSALSTGTRKSEDMLPPSSRKPSRLNDTKNPPTPRPASNASSRAENPRPSSSASRPSSGFGATSTAAKYAEISQRDNSSEAASFESFSGVHLKSRTMQHNVVTRTLDGKTVLTIPQLLKTVKAPEYDPPDLENDYVVMGVICSKSTPLNTKNTVREQTKGSEERNQQGKFMVIKLTDLKWELDLFLFDTGFSQFWKLPLGTLIAVLNPDIMPPRTRDTGKFSLKLTSSDDTILELGTARDLDFCHAVKQDGKECGSWIDSRKTEYCEWHLQNEINKTKRARGEVNSMVGGGPRGGKFGMFGGRGPGKGDELKREGRYHDRESHETVYIAPGPGSAMRAFAREEQGWGDGVSRQERHRKQLAEREKERELAKKLGSIGRGTTGGEYLKMKSTDTSTEPNGRDTPAGSASQKPSEQDFSSLLNRKAEDVSLAPTKRKRIASGKSTASSEPMGWSRAFKPGVLLSPTKETPSAMRGTREASPAKKKARLLLPDKGIREPGRESLGGLDVGLIAAMDEDDDDLEII